MSRTFLQAVAQRASDVDQRHAGLAALDDDVLTLVLRSTTSPQEITRLARTCRRCVHLVRRLLRDRTSPQSVWRRFCACFCEGVELASVADYGTLHCSLRGAAAPARRGMTIAELQFIVQVHVRTAIADGGERKELVFSEVVHGAQSVPSDDIAGDVGFAWLLTRAANRLDATRPSYASVVEECHHSDMIDVFASQEKVASWGQQRRQGWVEERIGLRTFVMSVCAFRASTQKVCQLMTEAKATPDFSDQGGPGGWDRDGLSFEHTPLGLVPEWSSRGVTDHLGHAALGRCHLHAALLPPSPPDVANWGFHLNVTVDDEMGDGMALQSQELALMALECLPYV